MGFERFKHYRLRCDVCRRYYITDPPFVSEEGFDILVCYYLEKPKLQDGWEYHTSGGRGMTGYTATDLLCPDCAKNRRERDEQRG